MKNPEAVLKVLAVLYWFQTLLTLLAGLGLLLLTLVFLPAITAEGAITCTEPSDCDIVPAILAMLGGFWVVLAVLILLYIAASYFPGLWLYQRRRRTWCIWLSALHLLNFPWGTLLGGATLVALSHPVIKPLFRDEFAGPPAPSSGGAHRGPFIQ